MFVRRDFDLNSNEAYGDSTLSLKEAFRKTMVSQEIVFQSQVHELHRIYGTQRSLMMQNNSWIEFDRFNLNDTLIGSTHSKSTELLEGCQGLVYKLHQRPFVRVDHQQDNLKLSLSIGDKNKRKKIGNRTWFDVNLSRDVIDLEDSNETMSNDDLGEELSSLPSKHESQKSVVTDDNDRDRTSFDRVIERFDLNVFSEDLPSKKEQIMLDLDLNKVYFDDSSCHSNDLISTSHELVVTDNEPKFWTKEECNNFSDEASGTSLIPENSTEIKALCQKENDESIEITKKAINEKRLEHSNSDISSSSNKTCQSSNESDKFDDASIREAAESLVHIAFESSDFDQIRVDENNNVESETETEMTQSSEDSFERFTLGLKECTEDDLCVSSPPNEMDFAENNNNNNSNNNNDRGLKIRRGRRLKDFQRDILPGLASLSRHEIREDINILEGVLRSREYKKMQAKMADEGRGWCVPTRSRRSRLNHSKRRRFS